MHQAETYRVGGSGSSSISNGGNVLQTHQKENSVFSGDTKDRFDSLGGGRGPRRDAEEENSNKLPGSKAAEDSKVLIVKSRMFRGPRGLQNCSAG